jgi:hypothetical protein
MDIRLAGGGVAGILYQLEDYPNALIHFYRIMPLLKHKGIVDEHAINLYNVMALIFQKTEKLDSRSLRIVFTK